jgi:hypothetical protein
MNHFLRLKHFGLTLASPANQRSRGRRQH